MRITIASMISTAITTTTVLLAIDTSTEYCSVALLCSDASGDAAAAPRVWAHDEKTGAVSSARVLPLVREVLGEAGLTLARCDAIAFGAGPGSFTGLRTATGVAQGLAFGLNVPVVPVGTLLACAESARLHDPSVRRVLAVLDARMDEVYWADYVWCAQRCEWQAEGLPTLSAPMAVSVPDEPFVLAGNAMTLFGERLAAAACAQTIDMNAVPSALPIAHAALRAYRAGRTVSAEQAMPDYVRDKVAQTTAERLAVQQARVAAASAPPRERG